MIISIDRLSGGINSWGGGGEVNNKDQNFFVLCNIPEK